MRALDLLFPRICASCGETGRVPLCPACEAQVPWIAAACLRCALPECAGRDRCEAPRGVYAAAAAALYEGAAREALIRFKVRGERRAASAFARAMLAPLARLPATRIGAAVPVPSGGQTLRARGFNPAAAIARPLALLAGLDFVPALAKVVETEDLATLGRAQRLRALDGAFAARVAPPSCVLLVDDVITTGATMSACAAALRKAGARTVFAVAFARTPPARGRAP